MALYVQILHLDNALFESWVTLEFQSFSAPETFGKYWNVYANPEDRWCCVEMKAFTCVIFSRVISVVEAWPVRVLCVLCHFDLLSCHLGWSQTIKLWFFHSWWVTMNCQHHSSYCACNNSGQMCSVSKLTSLPSYTEAWMPQASQLELYLLGLHPCDINYLAVTVNRTTVSMWLPSYMCSSTPWNHSVTAAIWPMWEFSLITLYYGRTKWYVSVSSWP